MKPNYGLGMCLLCLSLAAPVAATEVPAKVSVEPIAEASEVEADRLKDQWGDWEEPFDDEWNDRRDRNRDRDRDRFEDDDFFDGVDDRRGRDRDDVREDYDDWRYGDRDRDDDDWYYRDRDRNDDGYYRDRDRDNDGYYRDRDRRNRVLVCRNGVCREAEERDDRYWDGGRSVDRNFEYRLEDNEDAGVLPFILRILEQL